MMSQKHYRALAEAIKHLDLPIEDKCKVYIAIGAVCKIDNPKFKWDVFRKACGLE